MSAARALAVLALAVALGGCGAGAANPARAPSGRAVFARSCTACHSLTGHSTPRQQGGDLLRFHSTRRQLIQLTREMPVHPALTPAQLRAVVDYLQAVENR